MSHENKSSVANAVFDYSCHEMKTKRDAMREERAKSKIKRSVCEGKKREGKRQKRLVSEQTLQFSFKVSIAGCSLVQSTVGTAVAVKVSTRDHHTIRKCWKTMRGKVEVRKRRQESCAKEDPEQEHRGLLKEDFGLSPTVALKNVYIFLPTAFYSSS